MCGGQIVVNGGRCRLGIVGPLMQPLLTSEQRIGLAGLLLLTVASLWTDQVIYRNDAALEGFCHEAAMPSH